MALIDQLAGNLVKGAPDRRHARRQPARHIGPGGGGAGDRPGHTTARSAFDIARNPRLGLGEAYMDGRITIEDGDILDLLRAGRRRQSLGGRRRRAQVARQGQVEASSALFRRNPTARARQQRRASLRPRQRPLRLFLDDDLQYSCAYYTDPANSLEQAQRDKKAHIAAKLAPEAGAARARHRLRLGRDGALPQPGRGCRVLGITLSEEQLKVARERAEEAGVADQVQVRADRLSRRRPARSTGSSRSACSSMSAPRITKSSSPSCRDCLRPDGVMLLHTIGKLGKAGQRPTRSPTNISSPATTCRRSARSPRRASGAG